MLGENKTIKDSNSNSSVALRDFTSHLSYSKTNKLIAGLYMVTDIIDKDEPIRHKLRTLGTEIISDINSFSPRGEVFLKTKNKISEVMSFLDIAAAVGIISTMNSGILKKEFLHLEVSIKESIEKSDFSQNLTLSDLMSEETASPEVSRPSSISIGHSNGHINYKRIGVQHGHTLMKALSDRLSEPSNSKQNFDFLKKERRYEITKIIKDNPNGVTITDIRTRAQGTLATCSEKTLQRELISMLKDGVVRKTGEKRWSRYFLSH